MRPRLFLVTAALATMVLGPAIDAATPVVLRNAHIEVQGAMLRCVSGGLVVDRNAATNRDTARYNRAELRRQLRAVALARQLAHRS